MRFPVRLPAALAALLIAVPLPAQIISIPFGGPKKEKPSPNRDLRGSPAGIPAAVAARGRPAAMVRLDAARHPAEVLQNLGLPLAARVLDVEATPGYYAEIIAAAVAPGGKVTLLVPPGAMTDAGARKALIEMVGRVPNVALLAATPAKAAFAPGQFDFVLLHRADPADTVFIRKVFAAVRPGGIVGYVGDPHARSGAADSARSGAAETVTPAFVAAGFVVDAMSRLVAPADDGESSDDPADRIVVRFVRPE